MEIKLATFPIEVITPQFLYWGNLQPRGELFTYLNDRRYLTFNFLDAEFKPMPNDYRIPAIKQENININWRTITYIALLNETDLAAVQLLQSKRPVTFYTDFLAIRGNLHINPDAHENDLVDEARDFIAVSDAAVYPMRALKSMPKQRIPLIALNRHHILSYHTYQPKDS